MRRDMKLTRERPKTKKTPDSSKDDYEEEDDVAEEDADNNTGKSSSSTDSIDEDDNDDDSEDELAEAKKKKITIIIIAAVVVVLLIGLLLFLNRGGNQQTLQPIVSEDSTTNVGDESEVDPLAEKVDELSQNGIGKAGINENNIFAQGNIEANTFRKDFLNTDVPETYTLPIQIVNVNDSVSYVKHRTITDDGMDMYWVEAVYKGKKTEFTIPYYVYRSLANEGVMDVSVETVTDDTGAVYITGFTALVPTDIEDDESGF